MGKKTKIKVVLELEVEEGAFNVNIIEKHNKDILESIEVQLKGTNVISANLNKVTTGEAIWWGIEDVEYRAGENAKQVKKKVEELYDISKFENVLNHMIHKHDANNGVNWDVIDALLSTLALKE